MTIITEALLDKWSGQSYSSNKLAVSEKWTGENVEIQLEKMEVNTKWKMYFSITR